MKIALLYAALSGAAYAQQPFYTDDADVTDRRHFHFEISNQQSWLQRSALPATRQNTTVLFVNYGLTRNFELGVDGPLILLAQQNTPLATGPGDLNFTFKLRLRPEDSLSAKPAITLSCAIEAPTGNTRKQLGSGLADYGCNSVLQKQFGFWTLRINNGAVFSGNTLTGVIGLRAKGFVYLGSASLTRSITKRLLLGFESRGSVARQGTALGKNILQFQAAGKFQFAEDYGFDFGLLTGLFSGAPHFGLQLGLSIDY